MTTVVDPWNILPSFVLLLGSFGIPYLHHAIHAPKDSRKETHPLWLQGLFFFIASFCLRGLLSSLLVYSAVLYNMNPIDILLFVRFLDPMLALLIVAINWYQLVIGRSLGALIVTLLVIGALTLSLGALFVAFMPLIQTGQPPAAYLYYFMYPTLGLTLIFTGTFAWVKKEHFLELLST